MSWLKKFGQAILKITQVVLGIAPVVESAVPQLAAAGGKVVSELTQIAGVVTTAEGMFAAVADPAAKTGSQKLTAAAPFVAQIIHASEFMVGKNIKDPDLFEKATTEITSGVADLLNSLGA
ncbi:MAG: hypothetical protein ACRD5L_17080 [Bryobacteraceae bacterium]